MARRVLRAALAVLIAVAGAACADQNGRPAASAVANGHGAATVTLVDVSFSPRTTDVRVGDVVAWVWNDRRVEHDVVFDDGPASPRQRTGTWRRAFDRPGTYEYVCSLHPTMKGRVVVD